MSMTQTSTATQLQTYAAELLAIHSEHAGLVTINTDAITYSRIVAGTVVPAPMPRNHRYVIQQALADARTQLWRAALDDN